MVRRSAADYQRRYRQRMLSQGMRKVEVWVPNPLRGEIQTYAERLRALWAVPHNGSGEENFMWTNSMLENTLNDSEPVEDGSWSVEVMQGADECLVVTLASHGDLQVYITISGDQILASTLLWAAGSVTDQAALNAELLTDHKLLPLSTFGITNGPGGEPWYELFGALSARSTAESVMTEITTLADNALDVAEAYREFLAT